MNELIQKLAGFERRYRQGSIDLHKRVLFAARYGITSGSLENRIQWQQFRIRPL